MLYDTLYRSSRLALLQYADDLPSFWRLLGDGSDEITDAYDAFIKQRSVLNQVLSLGLHIGANDMSSALDLAYRLDRATTPFTERFQFTVAVAGLDGGSP
jgi:hypothetical protein